MKEIILEKELNNYIETIYEKYDLDGFIYNEEEDYVFAKYQNEHDSEYGISSEFYMNNRIRHCNLDKCGYDENDYYDFVKDFNTLVDEFN